MAAKESSTGLLDSVRNHESSQRLMDEARNFVESGARHLATSATDRVTDLGHRLSDYAENGDSSVLKGVGKLAEGKSPLKAVASAGAEKVGGAVKGLFGKGHEGGGDKRKTVNILEQIDIGVPRSVAYNQWTQFEEFGRFTKGVQTADQKDETTVDWRAKIAWSTRTWKATITEQVPDQRIAWTSEGDKGSVDGVVTFHELAPDLTRVLVDLDYHPKGFFEKTGNIWRAQGRRVRLDLKKFRAFVMMRGEETGAWRGEISDGDVVDSGEGNGAKDGKDGKDGKQSGGRRQSGEQRNDGDQKKQSQRSQSGKSDSQKSEGRKSGNESDDGQKSGRSGGGSRTGGRAKAGSRS